MLRMRERAGQSGTCYITPPPAKARTRDIEDASTPAKKCLNVHYLSFRLEALTPAAVPRSKCIMPRCDAVLRQLPAQQANWAMAHVPPPPVRMSVFGACLFSPMRVRSILVAIASYM